MPFPLVVAWTPGGAPASGRVHYRDSLNQFAETPLDLRATRSTTAQLPDGTQPPFHVELSPEHGYWPMLVEHAHVGPVDVVCPVLGTNAPHAWWLHDLGIDCSDRNRGMGVRVGLIDVRLPSDARFDFMHTVVHTTNPSSARAEAHAGNAAALMGATHPAFAFEGVAPSATFFFAQAGSSRSPHTVSPVGLQTAIEILSDKPYRCDLICVVVGDADEETPNILGAVLAAEARGTLCIFSGGNDPEQLHYPASYPSLISVGAFGAVAHPPDQSLEAFYRDTASASATAERYMLNSLPRSDDLTIVAPGIAIEAGPPHEVYTITGSSFAAPILTGALACLFAREREYSYAPRRQRAQIGRDLMRDFSWSSGLRGCRRNKEFMRLDISRRRRK